MIDSFRIFDGASLKRALPEFVERHGQFLRQGIRGYGYWLWKPRLILHALEVFPRSVTQILYVDAGSEINTRTSAARIRLADYQDAASDHCLHVMHVPGTSESTWTHPAVLHGVDLPLQHRAAPQRSASYLLFHRDQRSRDFLREWLDLASREASTWLTGEILTTQAPPPEFLGHRHDQSLMSSLSKVQQIPSIPDETYWPNEWLAQGLNYPIWTARNRSRYSVADTRQIAGAARRFSRVETRLWMESTWRLKARLGRQSWR